MLENVRKIVLGIGHLSMGSWGDKVLAEVYNRKRFFPDAQLTNM
jgi:hypothetical protein